MTKSEYVKQQSETYRKEWFKDHKAQLLLGAKPIPCCSRDENHDGNCDHHPLGIITQTMAVPAIIIGWQNPENWNYGCRFIIHRRWLLVLGDIGEATYEWGQDLTLEWLAGMDFGYFFSKCSASEKGHLFTMFNARVGYDQAQSFLADRDAADFPGEKDSDYRKRLRELSPENNSEEVEEIARKVYDYDGDAELASTVKDWFYVPHVRAIGHFVGLQMAITQLIGVGR